MRVILDGLLGVVVRRFVSVYASWVLQQRHTIAEQANEESSKVRCRSDYFGSRRSSLRAEPNTPYRRG